MRSGCGSWRACVLVAAACSLTAVAEASPPCDPHKPRWVGPPSVIPTELMRLCTSYGRPDSRLVRLELAERRVVGARFAPNEHGPDVSCEVGGSDVEREHVNSWLSPEALFVLRHPNGAVLKTFDGARKREAGRMRQRGLLKVRTLDLPRRSVLFLPPGVAIRFACPAPLPAVFVLRSTPRRSGATGTASWISSRTISRACSAARDRCSHGVLQKR